MQLAKRLSNELAFHDHQAKSRAATFRARPDLLLFLDQDYLDHEPWIRLALGRLGELTDLRTLDYGCGHAMASVVMARAGARVTAFDLSAGYLQEAQERARVNDVAIQLVQADGERLPFDDGSFDRIWGNAILHHLNLEVAAREIRRVLHPNGLAVFCEPWGENPLLNWARRRKQDQGKSYTPDERPLRTSQINQLRAAFRKVEIEGIQLLSMANRFLGNNLLRAGLQKSDALLLAGIPALQRFCRYVVITLQR
jgi:SAM-dependent methyltransferase